MKSWQLTIQAEQSLLNIARWTFENFGEIQANKYRDILIACINKLASDLPPHGKPCSNLLLENTKTNNIFYYHIEKHYIIYRESKNNIDVLEFFHEKYDLPNHLKKLNSK